MTRTPGGGRRLGADQNMVLTGRSGLPVSDPQNKGLGVAAFRLVEGSVTLSVM